jgi:hypothetical protein
MSPGGRTSRVKSVDAVLENIAWRRRGIRRDFVGSLRAGDDGIRLTGRDPQSGLDVALSIPRNEVEHVDVVGANGDPFVVVELARAEPIFVRRIGPGSVQAQPLARKLGALLKRRPR